MDKYDCLKLSNQLCFPLYAVSKGIIKKISPYIKELDLTYTQYLVMLVLWEDSCISVKELGNKLYLDSGTLTPVLKKLETKGFITRKRDISDERSLNIALTEEGKALKAKAVNVHEKMGNCIDLEKEDAMRLYTLLYKILDKENNKKI